MKTFENIVSTMFKMPPADVRDAMTPKDIPAWDSMNYLLFVAELEKNFNVSFSMDEVLSAKTLGDLKATLRAKGVRL